MRAKFLRRAQDAINDEDLQRALDQNAERRGLGRSTAFASLDDADNICVRAHRIRSSAIECLPGLIEDFRQNLKSNGWHVHFSSTAAEACAHISRIALKHRAEIIVKSKSMVTEEIGLNQALQRAGMTPVETDLGEFIVQLRDEPPGHIITPAIHLLREEIAETFVEHLGIDFTTDVSRLNRAARGALREHFLKAGIGISGVNFGVAEQGAICLVTNEGNGRMVTTLPNVHIAVMGIERLVRSLEDLGVMLQLLPRSATGQILSSYVSFICSPRRAGDQDGPSERHIILVDNGRSALRQSRLHQALMCIRCGACLNVCPVYREVGGHSYESVYPGPIGSVISPGMLGLEKYGHLAKASTLCGACREVCPVDIDLPRLLLRARDDYTRQVKQPLIVSLGMKFFRWVNNSPWRYAFAIKTAAVFTRSFPASEGWVSNLPGPLHAWTHYRDFPPFQVRPFRERFERNNGCESTPIGEAFSVPHEPRPTVANPPQDRITRFRIALEDVDGEFRRCKSNGIAVEIRHLLEEKDEILFDPVLSQRYPELKASLEEAGLIVHSPGMSDGDNRSEALARLDEASAGVTLCLGAIAESGTVIVGQDAENAALTSLLPATHIALVPADRFYESLPEWINEHGETTLAGQQSITLITGPSRTADIEMTLTIGVHGPGRLIVMLVD